MIAPILIDNKLIYNENAPLGKQISYVEIGFQYLPPYNIEFSFRQWRFSASGSASDSPELFIKKVVNF